MPTSSALHRWLRGGLLLVCLAILTTAATAQEVADQALHQAARNDDSDLADFALERGAGLEVRDQLGNTPLQVSAMYGSAKVAELLLARGADAAAATADDAWTALHYAAYEGHDRVARALIAAGAPLQAREGDYGNTPLHIAARRLKRPVVAALLSAGAEVDARDRRDGNTPLINAAFDPLGTAIVAELLAAGADPNATADDGSTPLYAAARAGAEGSLHLLLDAGAAPGARRCGDDGPKAIPAAARSRRSPAWSSRPRIGAALAWNGRPVPHGRQ